MSTTANLSSLSSRGYYYPSMPVQNVNQMVLKHARVTRAEQGIIRSNCADMQETVWSPGKPQFPRMARLKVPFLEKAENFLELLYSKC